MCFNVLSHTAGNYVNRIFCGQMAPTTQAFLPAMKQLYFQMSHIFNGSTIFMILVLRFSQLEFNV
jgi:hypothetical protein